MGKKGFIKGTILGGLTGVVAALLLAPKSGKQTQEDLKRALQQGRGDILDKLRAAGDELAAKAEALKTAAGDLRGEAMAESKDLLGRAEVLRQDIKIAGAKLAESSAQTGELAIKNAHKLMDESKVLLGELETSGRKLGAATRERAAEAVAAKKAD